MLTELIDFMARAVVDHPERVKVTEVAGETASLIELRVGEKDIGKIIGRGGSNVNAMRTILSAVACKMRKRAFLEVVESPMPISPTDSVGCRELKGNRALGFLRKRVSWMQ